MDTLIFFKIVNPFSNQLTYSLSNPSRLLPHFRFFHLLDNVTLTDTRAPNFDHHPIGYHSQMITFSWHYMLNTLAVGKYSNHYRSTPFFSFTSVEDHWIWLTSAATATLPTFRLSLNRFNIKTHPDHMVD